MTFDPDLLLLSQIDGLGARRLYRLIAQFGSAANVLSTSQQQLREFGLSEVVCDAIKQVDIQSIATLLEWEKADSRHHIIDFSSAYYPKLLQESVEPPPILYIKGQLDLLQCPQVAMVGSRSPSPGGRQAAFELAQALAENGIVVTSGLASGIDGDSHRGCLHAGKPTIAVCGTGVDRVFPAAHRELAHEIAERGALVSEHIPTQKGQSYQFSRRNRIIAGLSLATLVVEAAERSGSLITARYAMECNREVMAVPGSIYNAKTRGCHQLIKQGAKLVENVEDILAELPLAATGLSPETESRPTLSDDMAALLKHIDYETTPLDVICERSKLTVPEATNKLLTLELEGWITNTAGGFIRR